MAKGNSNVVVNLGYTPQIKTGNTADVDKFLRQLGLTQEAIDGTVKAGEEYTKVLQRLIELESELTKKNNSPITSTSKIIQFDVAKEMQTIQKAYSEVYKMLQKEDSELAGRFSSSLSFKGAKGFGDAGATEKALKSYIEKLSLSINKELSSGINSVGFKSRGDIIAELLNKKIGDINLSVFKQGGAKTSKAKSFEGYIESGFKGVDLTKFFEGENLSDLGKGLVEAIAARQALMNEAAQMMGAEGIALDQFKRTISINDKQYISIDEALSSFTADQRETILGAVREFKKNEGLVGGLANGIETFRNGVEKALSKAIGDPNSGLSSVGSGLDQSFGDMDESLIEEYTDKWNSFNEIIAKLKKESKTFPEFRKEDLSSTDIEERQGLIRDLFEEYRELANFISQYTNDPIPDLRSIINNSGINALWTEAREGITGDDFDDQANAAQNSWLGIYLQNLLQESHQIEETAKQITQGNLQGSIDQLGYFVGIVNSLGQERDKGLFKNGENFSNFLLNVNPDEFDWINEANEVNQMVNSTMAILGKMADVSSNTSISNAFGGHSNLGTVDIKDAASTIDNFEQVAEQTAKAVETISQPQEQATVSTNVVSQQEVADMAALEGAVNRVTTAVQAKTEAFKTEQTVVNESANSEIASMNKLESAVAGIKNTAADISNTISGSVNELDEYYAGLTRDIENLYQEYQRLRYGAEDGYSVLRGAFDTVGNNINGIVIDENTVRFKEGFLSNLNQQLNEALKPTPVIIDENVVSFGDIATSSDKLNDGAKGLTNLQKAVTNFSSELSDEKIHEFSDRIDLIADNLKKIDQITFNNVIEELRKAVEQGIKAQEAAQEALQTELKAKAAQEAKVYLPDGKSVTTKSKPSEVTKYLDKQKSSAQKKDLDATYKELNLTKERLRLYEEESRLHNEISEATEANAQIQYIEEAVKAIEKESTAYEELSANIKDVIAEAKKVPVYEKASQLSDELTAKKNEEKKLQTFTNKQNQKDFQNLQQDIKTIQNIITKLQEVRNSFVSNGLGKSSTVASIDNEILELQKYVGGANNVINHIGNYLGNNEVDFTYIKEFREEWAKTVNLMSAKALPNQYRNQLFSEEAVNKATVSLSKLELQMTKFGSKNTAFKTNNRLLTEYNNLLERSRSATNLNSLSVQDLTADWSRFQAKVQEAELARRDAFTRLMNLGRRFSYDVLAGAGVTNVSDMLRNMVDNVHKLDTEMTILKRVSDETAESYSNFFKQAQKDAVALGATVSDIVNATAEFSKLGYDLTEAAQLANNAVMYAKVGDMDAAEAIESVTSIIKAYNIEAENSISLIDKMNEVGNNFAIDSEGIGNALQRSASSLVAAGNDLDESIALVTAGNVIMQNPEMVANGIKVVGMRIRGKDMCLHTGKVCMRCCA